MDIPTQSVNLSKNPEIEGFDLQAGESWIYPTNYPTRDYQFNIIQKALLKNTLVSLPTGLGKTFIAAVVMYNFYRWYPHGKIIFMAPTRPLVKQQIEACYNIMAIPPDVTAELTGTKASSSRSDIWLEKRVFFVTPQVLQNDLEKVQELGSSIKCLVFDEAHKAKGNHAYCEVIRKLLVNNHHYFRVLALSATPGSSLNDVKEVVQNLLISHLEFRTEESIDVQPYVFHRSLETVVVKLDDKLMEIRDEYLMIIEQYARTLIKFKIIQGNCGSLTKGKIFMIMKDFKNKNRGPSSSNYSEIMRCLNICVTLYHAFELLIRHGLRNFLSFFDEHIEKPLLRGNFKLRAILENIRNHLGPIPQIEVLPDGTYPEIPKDIKFGHPKHYKLRDILKAHFAKEDKKDSRVIVFFEYRESVMEAHTLLLQSRPLIQPRIFLGQGSGVTQKTQLGVVKAFREGKCNTLLSTCIGEEGLDVGEVDLIVCFDISNKSPIRMVQRMGRTGRKRAGSVLILVTEGKEQQTLKDCLIYKNNISTNVLGSSHLNNGLYPHNPRLVPANMSPKCEKIFITVKDVAKKTNTIDKYCFGSSNIKFSQNNEVLEYHDVIPETNMKSLAGNPLAKSENYNFFNGHIEKLRTVGRICSVGHSESTTILTELLCYADSKRFNIPIQIQDSMKGVVGKSLKQGDIRSMFFGKNTNCNTVEDDAMNIIRNISCQDTKMEIDEKAELSALAIPIDDLFRLVSNYLVSDLTIELKKCSYCNEDFDCKNYEMGINQLESIINNNNNSRHFVPSEDIINDVELENIENFIASLDESFFTEHLKQLDDAETLSEFENDNELTEDTTRQTNFSFEAPTSYLKLLDSFRDTDFITHENPPENDDEKHNVIHIKNTEKELLQFFKLNSISDMFYNTSMDSSQDTVIYSPEAEADEHNSIEFSSSVIETPEKNRNKENLEPESVSTKKTTVSTKIDDFCDLSYFGLTSTDLLQISKQATKVNLDDTRNLQTQIPSVFSPQKDDPKINLVSLQNKDCTAATTPVVEQLNLSPTLDRTRKKQWRRRSKASKLDHQSSTVTITQMINLLDEPDKNELFEPTKQRVSSAKEESDMDDFDISHNDVSTTFVDQSCTSSVLNCSAESIADAEAMQRKSPMPIRNIRKLSGVHTVSSSDERIGINNRIRNAHRPKIRTRPKCHAFLDMEAEVSDDEIVSEDEDDLFTQTYENSFVNDVTQNFNTEAHAMYLRSVRTPFHQKIVQRQRPIVDIADVYSQLPPTEMSEYLEDSFCVETDDEDFTQQSQLSQLDVLEKQLEERKKRKKTTDAHSGITKRRRIKCISSDDSD